MYEFDGIIIRIVEAEKMPRILINKKGSSYGFQFPIKGNKNKTEEILRKWKEEK